MTQKIYHLLAYIENSGKGQIFLIDAADIDKLPEGSHVWRPGEEFHAHINGQCHLDEEGAYSVNFPFLLKEEYRHYPKWLVLKPHEERTHEA